MTVKYRLYLPPRFNDKSVNEILAGEMLASALGWRDMRQGTPPEPDLMAAGQGVEVTIAAGGHTREGFINEYCDGCFAPGAADSASLAVIRAALERKSAKYYSTPRTSLAILCMLEVFDWLSDDNAVFPALCREIGNKYIAEGTFATVYLLLPTLAGEWYVYDVARARRTRLLILNHLLAPYYTAL